MRRKDVRIGLCVLLVCCLGLGTGFAVSSGEKVKFNGLIIGRNGDTLTLKTSSSAKVIIVLTDHTDVVQPKGLLGIRKRQMAVTALMPGLKIQVSGIGDEQSRVVATTIKFSKDDLQTAEAIQAGLAPTEEAVQTNKQNIQANKDEIAANKVETAANRERIAANTQEIENVNKRFSDLSDYDVKYSATVYFSSASAAISADDKKGLMKLAHDAVNLTGYIIEVKGFADTSGNAAMNQQLSMDRAQGVIAYLIQDCNVPVRHIVAPGAMGEADPAAPNETSQGRSQNRRVEVKVIVNRGLAGS